MKTQKNTFVLFFLAAATLIMISWDHFKKSDNGNNPQMDSNLFYLKSMESPWSEDQLQTIEAEYGDYFDKTEPGDAPAADDVMVQKISGDNYHLLIMAVYAFKNYSQQFVKINNNGQDLILNDDGTGYDKVAGDGIFTAKIYADVNEFRKQAIQKALEVATRF